MRLWKALQAPAEPSLTLLADPQRGESRAQEQSLLMDTYLQHILKYYLLYYFYFAENNTDSVKPTLKNDRISSYLLIHF